MTTWCVGGRAAPPRGGGSLAVCLLASSGSEKKRGTVLLTVAQTTTWCERRAVLSKTLSHIVLFYSVLQKNPHKNPCLIHYNVPPRPTPTFFSVIHHSELVDTTWSFTVFLVACLTRCEV